jgi:hypothetical protein
MTGKIKVALCLSGEPIIKLSIFNLNKVFFKDKILYE